MKKIQLTDKSFLKCNTIDFNLSNEEMSIINELITGIKKRENYLVCTPNEKMFFSLLLQTLYKEETINFKHNKQPEKRLEVLIITNKNNMKEFFLDCTVNTNELFLLCNRLHHHFGFCNIDDPYFARVYWRHLLYKYYSGEIPSEVPLHYIYPVATGYHTLQTISRGNRNLLGRKDSQPPTFNITDNIDRLKDQSIKYDYVFVDCSRIKKNISNFPTGTLFFFNSPLDDRIVYLQRYNLKQYLLVGDILKSINYQEPYNIKQLSQEMFRKTSINSVEIEYVSSNFEREIERAIQLLGVLKKQKFSKYDVHVVAKLIYLFIRMPVNAALYDLIAKLQPYEETIRDIMQELKESDYRYENGDFEQIIELLEDVLYKCKLDSVCPKWEQLKTFVLKEYSCGKSICIVSPNKIAQLALKEMLSISIGVALSDLEANGILFVLANDIINEMKVITCDSLVIYSSVNFRDLSLLLKCNYKNARVYLYNIEISLLINKLKSIINVENYAIKHFEIRYDSAGNIYTYLFSRLNRFVRQKKVNQDETLSKIMGEIAQSETHLLREFREYKGKKAVTGFLVYFKDNSLAFFTKNSRIQVLDKKNKRVIRKRFKDLGIKDEILFIDNDARKDIYNIFIHSIENVDINKKLYMLIERWRELYEDKFLESRMTDEKLYMKMRTIGWEKTTKSILRNWRTGYSYGPRDKEDIIFLGKVLEITEFIDNTDIYYNAMSKVRAERRRASRILNKIIYFSNKKIDHEEIAMIEKYNLSVEQLKESLLIKTVKKIELNRGYRIKPIEMGIIFGSMEKE
ncbi:DISARM system-associated protein DrmE [Bacillus paramycoides]|uniref:DISARM system-associated protein DrmE n=1 Tax=Bacillus paramycoides TaxID=2026194 RepID=UPI002E2296CF|nr:DISARM system-associated protein DrmE [Bacillus paramycoides]